MTTKINAISFNGLAEVAKAWDRMAEEARREREEMEAMDAWAESEMLQWKAAEAKKTRDFGSYAEEYEDELARLRLQYQQKLAEAEADLARMYKNRWQVRKACDSVKEVA